MGILARMRRGAITGVTEVASSEPVGEWYLVPGTGRTDNVFRYAAWQMAQRLEGDVNAYAAIWSLESGLKADAVNKDTGASGIDQFLPRTAENLGVSIETIRSMSAYEQLPYIEKHYRSVGAKGTTDPGTLYMYNFLPAFAQSPDSMVLGQQGGTDILPGTKLTTGKVYKSNWGFDKDKDGIFTVGDVKALPRSIYAAAKARGSIPIVPEEPSSSGGGSGGGLILLAGLGLVVGAIVIMKAGKSAGAMSLAIPG